MAELQGVKVIENAALRAPGRVPRDTRHAGAPADIESPPRVIEVKAFGTTNRGFDLWLETRQVDEAWSNPNIRQGDPAHFTLKVLGGERLARLLGRAKEKRHHVLRSMRPLPRS